MGKIKQYKKGVRTKITKNFFSTEMDCKCSNPDCQWTYVDIDHMKKLQRKRTKWKKAIKITSGYRCEKHNKDVGGSSKSQHVQGSATDIQVKGMSPNEVASDCSNFDGIGQYDTFTHTDSRGYKALWDFRKYSSEKI